jgi:hypothetical protein
VFVIEQHAHQIETGPGIVFSTIIPDTHYFNGRGGRVMPARHPNGMANVAPRLLAMLAEKVRQPVTIEDLIAYLAGVVAHRGFTTCFVNELVTPGIRVPLTADPTIWAETVSVGREVVWLHSYGTTFADPLAGRQEGDIRYPVGDPRRPLNRKAVPPTPLPSSISYDANTETLYIGQGEFAPVPAEVWNYDVGGMQVVKKWFSYRKADPVGRISSRLDKSHLERWPYEWTQELIDLLTVLRKLVELELRQVDLLAKVIAGPQITVADLAIAGIIPVPSVARLPHRHVLDFEDRGGDSPPDLFSAAR